MAQQNNPERRDKDIPTIDQENQRKERDDMQQQQQQRRPEKDVANDQTGKREKGEDRWKDSERNEQTAIDEEDEVV
ncbi:MAG TPA: hypothetical protein PK753_05960 [Ignavibacteria bacterium]|nr:hypothetical protein [Ignavibacteria bacterium]